MGGVYLLTNLRFSGQPLGYVFAFANCALFLLYILLGHRMARGGGSAGVERLAAAMLVAFIVVSPIGLKSVGRALFEPKLLMAGAGVGICSSVIPYICDQFAMAKAIEGNVRHAAVSAASDGMRDRNCSPTPNTDFSELVGIGCVIVGVSLRRGNDL